MSMTPEEHRQHLLMRQKYRRQNVADTKSGRQADISPNCLMVDQSQQAL